MDVDAVIARAPAVVIVDELAHTNVPGSRHAKRWRDVRASRRRNSVISAVNVSTWNRSTISSPVSSA